MKFKISDKSLFAQLLRSPWWVSFALAAGVMLVAFALLPHDFRTAGITGSLPFWVLGFMAAWQQRHQPSHQQVQAVLAQVALQPWKNFAAQMAQAFVAQGYSVLALQEDAVDFKLEQRGTVTLVACKRWKAATLGVEVLRELVAAMPAFAADKALCISLGEPTDAALRFAREQHITLLTAQPLAHMLLKPA